MSRNRKVIVGFSETPCGSPNSSVCHCCNIGLFANDLSLTTAMEASLDSRRLGAA